jgi:hypothetical protein
VPRTDNLPGKGVEMGKLLFGKDEKIACIVDVTLKGADDEALCIAYKTTTQFFGAGIYLKDDGYVLGIKGKAQSYYPLPAAEELKSFQEAGRLPTPLPPYNIGAFDYAFGYSLWLILVGMAIWYGGKHLLRSRSKVAGASSVAAP